MPRSAARAALDLTGNQNPKASQVGMHFCKVGLQPLFQPFHRCLHVRVLLANKPSLHQQVPLWGHTCLKPKIGRGSQHACRDAKILGPLCGPIATQGRSYICFGPVTPATCALAPWVHGWRLMMSSITADVEGNIQGGQR